MTAWTETRVSAPAGRADPAGVWFWHNPRPPLAILAGLVLLWMAAAASAGGAEPSVAAREIAVVGAIGPATADYVDKSLAAAKTAGAPLVILRLDTPGGLSRAMRSIVKAILASPVPVVGFVGPSGARAASAGTYILYATQIAAMAPATNLGAATPVSLGPGGKPASDKPKPASGQAGHEDDSDAKDHANPSDSATAERRKVVNDAVAYIRSLAEKNDRNADWAERAVRQGVSLSAKQALANNVIEHIAADERALLQAIDGATVSAGAGKRTLHSAHLAIEPTAPGWRTRLLSVLTQPTVAYLLFMLGLGGLLLEALTPGATVPGVIGAISLVAALFAFQVIPVNYAGLALIALGVALMVAEMFAPSFGILGLGGIAAFVFGSIMLMDTDVPGYALPLGAIAGIAVGCGFVLLGVIYLFVSSRRKRVQSGHAGLIGSPATALEAFEHEGWVLLHGESWWAVAQAPVAREQALVVTWASGLKVGVRAAGAAPDNPSQTAGTPPAGG